MNQWRQEVSSGTMYFYEYEEAITWVSFLLAPQS